MLFSLVNRVHITLSYLASVATFTRQVWLLSFAELDYKRVATSDSHFSLSLQIGTFNTPKGLGHKL